LLDYHQMLLRGPSPITVAQRELIAAYVSALNACDYCHGVHAATAAAFGVAEDLVTDLLADVDTAPVDEPMKPVLRLVRTLTLDRRGCARPTWRPSTRPGGTSVPCTMR